MSHATAPACDECGSSDVYRDAFACWDPASRSWVLLEAFDDAFCNSCGGPTTLTMQPTKGRAA